VATPARKSTAKKAGGRVTPKGGHPSNRAKPATFDRLKSKKGIVRRLPVYLDSEITAEFEEAKADFDQYHENDILRARTADDVVQAAVDRYQAAAEAMVDNTVTLVLRRPEIVDDEGHMLKGRLAYDWISEQNPPSEKQMAEWDKENRDEEGNLKPEAQRSPEPPYNPDTFAPALIAACLAEPVLTPEQVDELISEWSYLEAMTLFEVAMEVSNGSQIASLGNGSGGIPNF
jgi:hypothetical protein